MFTVKPWPAISTESTCSTSKVISRDKSRYKFLLDAVPMQRLPSCMAGDNSVSSRTSFTRKLTWSSRCTLKWSFRFKFFFFFYVTREVHRSDWYLSQINHLKQIIWDETLSYPLSEGTKNIVQVLTMLRAERKARRYLFSLSSIFGALNQIWPGPFYIRPSLETLLWAPRSGSLCWLKDPL